MSRQILDKKLEKYSQQYFESKPCGGRGPKTKEGISAVVKNLVKKESTPQRLKKNSLV